MKNDGGPAFPGTYRYTEEAGGLWSQEPGMSLRDWFAGMVLSCADVAGGGSSYSSDEEMAECMYRMADAMLREREKK